MDDLHANVEKQAGVPDDQLPVLADPSLKFWKDNAKALLAESIKSLEETAKQIIAVAGILEGLYFHAITYTNIRGSTKGWQATIYLTPVLAWLVSLCAALMVYFPQTYRTNINSARESRNMFESLVAHKRSMLKQAGIWLAVGIIGLSAALGLYIAG
jgi:hypothetical protein